MTPWACFPPKKSSLPSAFLWNPRPTWRCRNDFMTKKAFKKTSCSWSLLCMRWIPTSEASNACLVILPFHWNWFGWGTEVFHQSSKVPHLWVLAQIFTISVVFLIEKSVCKGADLRLWIPVVGGFFLVKKMDQNQRRRLRTSGVAAMGKKPAAQKMSLAAAWWWNQPFVLLT